MSEEGKAWLDQLESTVQQAAETIEALRRERDDLVHQVQELEAKVGELEAAGPGDGDGAGGEEAAAAWQEERQEIRRRVQKLTERLEGLLDK